MKGMVKMKNTEKLGVTRKSEDRKRGGTNWETRGRK